MAILSLFQSLCEEFTAFGLVLIFVCVLLLDYRRKHWNNQPPGPLNIPFIGYLPFLFSKRPHELLVKLHSKHGSVAGFYLGERYVVSLNDITAIRETLNRDEFLGRPKIHPMTLFEKNSMFVSNGNVWKQEKRLIQRTFHELGFGRKIMEERIKDEISHFMARIENYERVSFDMRKYLQVSVNNNISSLLFGHRFDYNDPTAMSLTDNVEELEIANSSIDITVFFPYVKPILFALGKDLVKKCRKCSLAIGKIIRNEIEEERKHLEDQDIRSYLHGYLLQMEKDVENTTFTENALLGTAKVHYIAGTSTTVNTIEWLLLALIANPNIQARVQREIDDFVSKYGHIEWSDRKKLPYTNATILETMRWRTLVPLSVPRCALNETTVMGYNIPRNTIILPNIWAAHNDITIWEKPEDFRPEHFLDEEGNVINTDACIPFSVGRRSCPGENLARLQVFLYSVNILGKYSVTLAKGDTLDLDGIPRFTMVPKAYKILLTPRA